MVSALNLTKCKIWALRRKFTKLRRQKIQKSSKTSRISSTKPRNDANRSILEHVLGGKGAGCEAEIATVWGEDAGDVEYGRDCRVVDPGEAGEADYR